MPSLLTLPTVVVGGQAGLIWPPFAVGETVNMPLQCNDPLLGTPLNLGGLAVVWTMVDQVSPFTVRISRQATVTAAAAGQCTVPIVSGDTVVGGAPLPFGAYNVDCWAEDGSGNRLDLAYGTLYLEPAYRLPNGAITPGPPQQPIAFPFTKLINFSSAAFVTVTWPDFGAPVYVGCSAPVTNSVDVPVVKVIQSTVTSAGCTVQASSAFTGYCLLTVMLQSGVN